MTVPLERILYGLSKTRSTNAEGLVVLATTPAVTANEAAYWRTLVSVQPLKAAESPEASRAYGIFAANASVNGMALLGTFGLMCAYSRDPEAGDTNALPADQPGRDLLVECVPLPRYVIAQAEGNIAPLLALFREPIRHGQSLMSQLTPFQITPMTGWTVGARAAALDVALRAFGGDFERVLELLGTALHDRGAIIYGYDDDSELRVRLIQGLMALLPATLRPDFTFSTNRHEMMPTQARLVFAEHTVASTRWHIDWADRILPEASLIASPAAAYLDILRAQWSACGKTSLGLVRAIETMDAIPRLLSTEKPLHTRLAVTAERFILDQKARAGEPIAIDTLKTALAQTPITADLRPLYMRRLTDHALAAHDAEAAVMVAEAMDSDPELDATLWHHLSSALIRHPDAVYAFIRARVAHEFATSPGGVSVMSGVGGLSVPPLRMTGTEWRRRLKAAALAALRFVIRRGDPDPLIAWLKLIAREPSAYELADVLHYGILAAQLRAHQRAEQAGGSEDDTLARSLAMLAIRRDPPAAELLLEDTLLMRALPDTMRAALSDHTGDPVLLLNTYGPDLLMFALARAAEQQQPALFTPFAIERVWETVTAMHSGEQTSAMCGLAASDLMRLWTSNGVGWMHEDTVVRLLKLVLAEPRDDLFYAFARSLIERPDAVSMLAQAMQDSRRSMSDILALTAQLIAVGDFGLQQALDLYTMLLDQRGWPAEGLPMMQQIARLLQQNPSLHLQGDALWNLLSSAVSSDKEGLRRAITRRLENELERQTDDAILIDGIQRLAELFEQPEDFNALAPWWRTLVRAQPTARLQRWEKLLEGRRDLDTFRASVQNAIAFRRLLGKRTLGQLAGDIATAYAVIGALSDAYEPLSRRAMTFDAPMMRAEIDARYDELAPQELQIFASNLKELANLIAELGDSRSRASLIRRGDDIDRQLSIGEQTPHSAVDTLKWMSGYFSGAQDTANEEE